ncbi:MAG: hypothetical protein LBL79_03570 [Prevotella sp.]|nr:hypothetical protein [Prevotella sp.]
MLPLDEEDDNRFCFVSSVCVDEVDAGCLPYSPTPASGHTASLLQSLCY